MNPQTHAYWTDERMTRLKQLWLEADLAAERARPPATHAALSDQDKDLHRAIAAMCAPMRYPHNPIEIEP
ncbi:MAG: hypothetical protein GC189_00735 [Alphaproteobacteria bacterium]|nr:hypothetical protein [Alphaproteobacteria bacterium]